MFLLLTRILLLLLIAGILYYVFVKLIAKSNLGWIIAIILFIFAVTGFINPNSNLAFSGVSLLTFPLKPLGLSILLLILAVAGINKNGITKTAKHELWTALLILIIFSLPWVAYSLAQYAELEALQAFQQREKICTDVCPDGVIGYQQHPGAIVLLGRGTTQANLPYRIQIQLTDTGDRILYTSQLYHQQRSLGNNPLVIVSAGPRADLAGDAKNIIEANDIKKLLVTMGVPAEQIITETRSVDLRTSAEEVRKILVFEEVQSRVILVSSALNIRRATATFNELGIRVIPRPTNFYTFQNSSTPSRRLRLPNDFLPDAEALVISTRVIEEFWLSIYYFLRGWSTPIVL